MNVHEDIITKKIFKYIDNVCGPDTVLKDKIMRRINTISDLYDADIEEAEIIKNVYTIGTSNLTIDEFCGILVENGIETLVDVRSRPVSRYSHFNRENLESFCGNHKLEYWWLGDILGGFQDTPFPQYCETDTWKDGIVKIKDLTKVREVVICCSERNYKKCHRRYIANELKDNNIIHLQKE